MSENNTIAIIQSVFLGAPSLDAELVLKLASIFTYDGSASDLKSKIRDIPEAMIAHLDSKYHDLCKSSDLLTVARLFRLEHEYRKGNLKEDYKIESKLGGYKISYKALSPIIGFSN